MYSRTIETLPGKLDCPGIRPIISIIRLIRHAVFAMYQPWYEPLVAPPSKTLCKLLHMSLSHIKRIVCIANYKIIFVKFHSPNFIPGGDRPMPHLDLLLAAGVLLSTAATDAVYVLFNAAVSSRRRIPAATWSSIWYLLSAFAVISYTHHWVYVLFAAAGSWIGAFLSLTFLRSSERDKLPRIP